MSIKTSDSANPTRKRRFWNSLIVPGERGQGVLEFALITPFVLFFLLAIVALGLTLHTRSNLQQAVREGARQAAIGASLTGVQSLVAGNSPDALQPTDVAWCLPAGSAGHVGDSIRVYIDEDADGSEGYSYEIFPSTGLFGALGSPGISVNMKPQATTRLEKSAAAGTIAPCT